MIFRVLRFIISAAVVGSLTLAAHAANDSDSAGSPGLAASASTGGGQDTTRADYVLQPQDQVRVQVFQEEDINKQCDGLSLSQDSTITLPLIGTISVKGRTVRQAEELIRSLYDRDYIVNPQVTLTVLKYAERSVNVIGSVTNQGRIKFPEERGLTIVDAISLAGGQTRLADLKHVKLTRKNADGETEVTIVDVDAIMKSAGHESVMLQPGDVIFVPERIL